MNIVEIYLQADRYNPRIKATIAGAWMAVCDNGDEFPVCRDYEAKNEAEVRAILNSQKG
jgi:hypothetical protein